MRLMARRLFFAGRRALLVSTMLGREDHQQVLAYGLAARFLLLDRRITEAWTCVANAVKTAHSIGLHRDGSKLHLSEEESEMRRRVWSSIYFTDRNLCMNLGRPTQIDDSVVDSQIPSEEDDHDVFPEMFKPVPSPSLPAGPSPSPLSYTKHRHLLAVIMGKIISTYQNLHTLAHYSDIISIDKELDTYRKNLPDYLRSELDSDGRMHHVATAWDTSFPFVPIHRYMLQSEVDHIRVSLHRPYLLRTNHKTGHRYEYSRRACIAAAHHNILLRRNIIDALHLKFGDGSIPKVLHLHLGTYKTLNSLIIIGMYLIVTPEAEDAEMLLGHLRFYDSMWRKKQQAAGYVRDETKDREASIVQVFLQRIEEVRKASEEGGNGKAKKTTKRGSETESGRSTKRKTTAARNGSGGQRSMTGQAKSTEEDTAGVLLDLNQSAREGGEPPYNQYVSTFHGGGRKEAKGGGDVMPPWPYLPMNTHQNTPSKPPSMSNGSGPSPVNTTLGSDDGGHHNPGATSAQQLFESWFRYNAFDSMDFDALNPSVDMSSDPLSSQQASGTVPTMNAKIGYPVVDAMLHGPDSPGQRPLAHVSNAKDGSAPGAFSSSTGVQLSTVPAPVWSTAGRGAKQGGFLASLNQGNALADVGATNVVAGGPGSLMPWIANSGENAGGSARGMGPAMTVKGDQINDASYDPDFWQRCVCA